MTLSIEQLRRVRTDVLRAAAADLERDRQILTEVTRRLLAARVSGSAWTGHAAAAAAAASTRRLESVRALCLDLAASSTALQQAATSFDAVRDILVRADRVAEQVGGWLSPDGRLVLPPRVPHADPVLEIVRSREEERARWEVTCLLERARLAGATADVALASDLRRALETGACVPGPTGGAVPAPPLAPSSDDAAPFAASAWWRSLSREQQATVVRERPSWVGSLDGIPAADRDAANRALLRDAERLAAEQLRQAEALGAPLAAAATTQGALVVAAAFTALRRRARERVADLRAVRDLVDAPDGRKRQLLLLDASAGPVRAAVALGDVDAADHVATFVGGFTTSAQDLARYDRLFAALGERVDELAGPPAAGGPATAGRTRAAYITWVGYDAPQQSEVLSPHRSVLGDDVARAAATPLARFVSGLAAARDVLPHSVLLAHSYGTLVAAHALRTNTGVDDVALFGSPGVDGAFTSLAAAGLKPGSLNVLTADWDLVASSGWFPLNPGQVAGATVLATTAALLPGPRVRLGSAATGHSDYLKPGSTSQHNLAALILRRPDLFVRPPR